MSRELVVVAAMAISVLPNPCRKDEPPPPPPVEVKTAPTPATNAKWAKARSAYETSAKANGVAPDVAAAVLALMDRAKAAGEDSMPSGSETVDRVDHKARDMTSDLEKAIRSMPRSLTSSCSVDKRPIATTADAAGFGFGARGWEPTEEGLWATVQLLDSGGLLSIAEVGTGKRLKQLEAKLSLDIRAPFKPPVHVERKLDVGGMKVKTVQNQDYETSMYEQQIQTLLEKACAALTEILGTK